MSQALRHRFGLVALVAAVALAGCANQTASRDPYSGYRDPYGNGGYPPGARGPDAYYNGYDYERYDPNARLEREQEHERKDLDQEQSAEEKRLKQAQEQERQQLKAADQWDDQDRREQKSERKQQKRVFKQEDRELSDQQQRELWQQY